MPRVYWRALGAAAVLLAGPAIGAGLAYANARRCGMSPHLTDHVVRWPDAAHPQ